MVSSNRRLLSRVAWPLLHLEGNGTHIARSSKALSALLNHDMWPSCALNRDILKEADIWHTHNPDTLYWAKWNSFWHGGKGRNRLAKNGGELISDATAKKNAGYKWEEILQEGEA